MLHLYTRHLHNSTIYGNTINLQLACETTLGQTPASQSSLHTAQIVLNATTVHLAVTRHLHNSTIYGTCNTTANCGPTGRFMPSLLVFPLVCFQFRYLVGYGSLLLPKLLEGCYNLLLAQLLPFLRATRLLCHALHFCACVYKNDSTFAL